jgi:hypothetical protein|tara:strand:+ start:196 stop:513 length:318 start_codon:yes stop_codon:yes gene_type:complete
MVKDIKSNLTNIVVIIGLIGSIGAGFIKYGEIMTKIDVLTNASKSVDIDYSAQIAVLEEKVADIYNVEEGLAQTKVKALINSKEIELLKVQLKELKISTSNPLSN